MMRLSLLVLCATLLPCSAADRIAFTHLGPTQATLFISSSDGAGERPLTQPSSLNYNPAWSPQGDWLAFTSERAGSADSIASTPTIRPHSPGTERKSSL